MKFIIKKNVLLESLMNTSKAISTRNLIPILTGIKFELKKEGLYLLVILIFLLEHLLKKKILLK